MFLYILEKKPLFGPYRCSKSYFCLPVNLSQDASFKYTYDYILSNHFRLKKWESWSKLKFYHPLNYSYFLLGSYILNCLFEEF